MKNFHIRKDDDVIQVMDNDNRVVYSSARHSAVRVDRPPYLSGFSKLVDFGSSYQELLKNVHRSSSQSIRNYWKNVGKYTLDVMADNR